MNIFRLSCLSNCGSYFSAYLQSVMVVAETKEQAIIEVKEILKANSEEFIYGEKKWDVDDLGEVKVGWYSCHYDSDY